MGASYEQEVQGDAGLICRSIVSLVRGAFHGIRRQTSNRSPSPTLD